MAPDAELVGVDASEAMVGLARRRVTDPRARFLVGPAAAVARAVEPAVDGAFDRLLSNAAFWQFPTRRPVLAALARLASPGAILAFNVPAERLDGERAEVHPFQVALARAVERRSGRRFPTTPTTLDPVRLGRRLGEAGFHLERRERFEVTCRQEELMELTEIPAMLGPMTPGLDDPARSAAVAEARDRSDPNELVQVCWCYFVARRVERE